MKLYHGTSGNIARKIIAGADLLPRRLSKRSNWTEAPSCPDAVYLTNAYPIYFAANHDCRTPAVLEIETDRLNPFHFAPDEDALEQSHRAHDSLPKGWTLRQRTNYYRNRLRSYQDGDKWLTSLRALGTCCHFGAIPRSAITRVAFIDRDEGIATLFEGVQPLISLANFKFCGERYKALTASLWADPAPEGVTTQDIAP